jgi:2-keto-4-pentenoate hydratase/2-oxohepta-3-ene-1,7-dioic acid hydratase in catechol pathway
MSYKLLSYLAEDGPRAGLLIGESVFDAQAVTNNPNHRTVLGILDDWPAAEPLLIRAAEPGATPGTGIALEKTHLLAPILYPGQIWAAGSNYQDHIDEMTEEGEFPSVNAKKIGGRPWHFAKSSRSAVTGHAWQNKLPAYSKSVDWEIELAAVIGRTASKVSAADALNYIAGYTIANDLSARDFVARDGIAIDSAFRFDWLSHKGFDNACPMGPWITPARDIADPQNLDMKLWIDDEMMQNSNTKYMIFSIAEQIEEISARVTMHPGDVILTGTPSGVGMGRGRFLKSGEQLRLWIQDIGELRHGVTREDA